MKDYLSLPYTLTQIVEKCFYYTGSELNKQHGLYVLAHIGEEFKSRCQEDLFEIKKSIELVDKNIKNNSWQLVFDDQHSAKLKANSQTYNLCAERLYAPLRDMLRPVWNVYWGESATSLVSISIWLLRADEDNGAKVFAKLQELKDKAQ